MRLAIRPTLTLEGAVDGLPFSEATLQRVETGNASLRQAGHLRALLARYGLDEGKAEDAGLIQELLAIQREAANEEWVADFTDAMTPRLMGKFVGIEEGARQIKAFHPLLWWGSLQTEAYARAIFAMQQPVLEAPSESVELGVQLRVRRRMFLTRSEDPVKLHAIIGEPALRHVIGGDEVMQAQFQDVIDLCASGTVTLQVLPSTGVRYRFTGDFSILDLGDELPPQVQVDTALGALAMSGKPRDVGVFTRRFEALTASALPPEETLQFVRQLTREIT
ncbi:DUF5753 domain-containing protein [Streptomyces sp. NBC_00838]|uniref:DUF5753 domain-containing protein n=1 Tax=Streptomyces sp. NBC_00838 TaxID=2903680 RepID=UPI00386CC941|nr:DUF5753 domain-containing protein [Streptomyces sp. NBC_00838]